MHRLAYTLLYESESLHICETARLGHYSAKVPAVYWTEEDLDRIRRVLRRLTAMRVDNPEDAEDLVQETLLTMVRKAPQIYIEKGPLIWAMGILRKKVGNYYRRAQRFASLDDGLTAAREAARSAPAVPSQESSLHHAELRAMIDGFLGKLPAPEREAIVLYLGGKQTSEIVSLLHPERYQNVVNRLHRGRKKLARELARHGYAKTVHERRR